MNDPGRTQTTVCGESVGRCVECCGEDIMLTTDTKANWKRRALRAEAEVQTLRNIRAIDNTTERRLIVENADMRVLVGEIRDALAYFDRVTEMEAKGC